MRFKFLTSVKTSVLVFWVATPCSLVDRLDNNVSEEHTALKMEAVPLNRSYLQTRPHGVTTQKTNIDI
jgi:hypothetical protein